MKYKSLQDIHILMDAGNIAIIPKGSIFELNKKHMVTRSYELGLSDNEMSRYEFDADMMITNPTFFKKI